MPGYSVSTFIQVRCGHNRDIPTRLNVFVCASRGATRWRPRCWRANLTYARLYAHHYLWRNLFLSLGRNRAEPLSPSVADFHHAANSVPQAQLAASLERRLSICLSPCPSGRRSGLNADWALAFDIMSRSSECCAAQFSYRGRVGWAAFPHQRQRSRAFRLGAGYAWRRNRTTAMQASACSVGNRREPPSPARCHSLTALRLQLSRQLRQAHARRNLFGNPLISSPALKTARQHSQRAHGAAREALGPRLYAGRWSLADPTNGMTSASLR